MARATSWMLAVGLIIGAVTPAFAGESTPPLDVVLERLARISDLYVDQALRFTCNESIYYTRPDHAARLRFRYIYRVTDEGRLDELREPRTRGNSGESAEDAIRRADLPALLLRPYSWVLIFSRAKRDHFRFTLDGVEKVNRVPALRVRFEAIPPYKKGRNEWVGTAWVDRATFQIVRIEAWHVDDGQARLTRYTTDFNVIKHGMRFPGNVLIADRRRYGFEVTQTYRKYRFFQVRTEAEIRSFVLHGQPGP